MKRTPLSLLVLALVACANQATPADAQQISVSGVTTSTRARVAYPAVNTIDGKLSTYWSAERAPQAITWDFGSVREIDRVTLDLFRGDKRAARFSLFTSPTCEPGSFVNRLDRVRAVPGQRVFTFQRTSARCVRFVGFGNSENNTVAIAEAVFEPINDLVGVDIPNYNPDTGAAPTPAPAPAPINPSGGTTTNPDPVVVTDPGLDPTGDAQPPTVAYYIDCAGSDDNNGRSPATAWRSLSKLSTATVAAGEGVMLKRGCVFSGQLAARFTGTATNRVIISAYGTGNRPEVRGSGEVAVAVTGNYQEISSIAATTGNVPPVFSGAVRCTTTPQGWRVGFGVSGDFNVIRNVKAYGNTVGLQFTTSGNDNLVRFAESYNNTIMSKNNADNGDNDSGAWAFLFNGDKNTVSYSKTYGNVACSEDYTIEGAAFEIYLGDDNRILYNEACDTTFTELGGHAEERNAAGTITQQQNWAQRNIFAYNKYSAWCNGAALPRGEWVVLRGRLSKWGANPGTKVYQNSAYWFDVGVACVEGCEADILWYFGNNIHGRNNPRKSEFWSDGDPNEGGNMYWREGGGTQVTVGGGRAANSAVANPLFVAPKSFDLHLQGSSTAIGRAQPHLSDVTTGLGLTTDLDRIAIPQGGSLDSGAYEFK